MNVSNLPKPVKNVGRVFYTLLRIFMWGWIIVGISAVITALIFLIVILFGYRSIHH